MWVRPIILAVLIHMYMGLANRPYPTLSDGTPFSGLGAQSYLYGERGRWRKQALNERLSPILSSCDGHLCYF